MASKAVIEGTIKWDTDFEEHSGINQISVRGLSGFIAEAIQDQTDIEINWLSMGICETEPVRITIERL